MNKKGFTLIELLAVIAIIGLISIVAIPNLVGLQDGIKKDQMLDDAKKLISMAKYKVNTDYDIRNFKKNDTGIVCKSSSKYCTFTLDILDTDNQIVKDPDDGEYNRTSSKIRYDNSTGVVKYCIYLLGSKRRIGTGITLSKCVLEENLYSRSKVADLS